VRQSLSSDVDTEIRALAVSRHRAWSITVLAMLALSVTLVQRQALAALAVTVTDSLAISHIGYGWLSSGFASAYLIGSLPAARLIQVTGPRIGLAATLACASLVIGLHGVVESYPMLLALRIMLGLAVAPSFACAAHTLHRVLPFKDRARGIGMLYMGNSLGSAVCPPLTVLIASMFGWRDAFVWVAAAGIAWIPFWIATAFTGQARLTLDKPSVPPPSPVLLPSVPARRDRSWLSLTRVVRNPAIARGNFVVAAAAPITTVMLLWGAKYLADDHGVAQNEVGHYLWAPALFFGSGSLLFGELRARSARARVTTRPPRGLVAVATVLSALMAAVPSAHDPQTCIAIASIAMMGAGGLYTLATTDMLTSAARGTIPATTGLTTLTQSFVYIVVSPVIGTMVEHFGNYRWVMIGAGLWVLPGCIYWLLDATLRGAHRARTAGGPQAPPSNTQSDDV